MDHGLLSRANGLSDIADFKVTLNPVILDKHYQLPTFDNFVSKRAATTQIFGMRNVYLQLKIEEQDKD